MKPLIGITAPFDHYTGQLQLRPFYAQAVSAFGGMPVILPYGENTEPADELADRLDGILFSGGTNIDPYRYGDTPDGNSGKIEYERDKFELELYSAAIKLDMPVLGICRGCQLLNVAAGGTLYRGVENHIQTADKDLASHDVEIMRDTPLYDIFKADRICVNSFHEQLCRDTGAMRVAGKAENGMVEAIYMPGKRFVIGVQWHPERMYMTNTHAAQLFRAFVECGQM